MPPVNVLQVLGGTNQPKHVPVATSAPAECTRVMTTFQTDQLALRRDYLRPYHGQTLNLYNFRLDSFLDGHGRGSRRALGDPEVASRPTTHKRGLA